MAEEETLQERIRLTAAALKEKGVLSQEDLEGAELLPAPGNANRFVPWTDPNIPYECVCGTIIYSDTPHFHPGDEPEHSGVSPEEQDIDAGR